ncbi:MAG: DUF4132 domain-containing protein [Planctomycetes bacterium]|nr:DUF4132 domain-containing protein [Planctomycetota bacterium]
MANDDLNQEFEQLEARDALSEDDPKPRGALPGLFRALRAGEPAAQQAGVERLAEQLADLALVTPTLELVRELGLSEAFLGAVPPKGRYCVADQVLALARVAPSPSWTLDALTLLLDPEAPDPTELALALGPEETCAALAELLRLRLRVPARRRDRTSARLAEGALRALAALAPDLGTVQRAVAQILTAETRRAGKGEPTLALAALDAVGQFPAVERLRLIQGWTGKITRKKVVTRFETLRDAAVVELGLDAQELLELLARTGELDASGLVAVDLDEGGRVGVGLTPSGELRRVEIEPGEGPLTRADEQALKTAEVELRRAWCVLVERLELALVSGRDWSSATWTLIFRGAHPLWQDLVPRVVWERRRAGERTWFRVGEAGPLDVFGDALELGADDRIGLAHPTLADPDEFELWQEWALTERRVRAPFLQLFRAVLSAEELETFDFAGLRGRELFREEVTAWARAEGFRGAPLVGTGPWDLWKESRGLDVALVLNPVSIAFKATLIQRKAAHRRVREGEKVVIRGHKDEQPRATLGQLEIKGEASDEDRAVVRAETLRALEGLTTLLLLPDELWLRAWQAEKWRDPGASWKEAVLRYREGSPATLTQRKTLLRAFTGQEGIELRIEGRFAITAATVIDLGSGRCHAGPPKDYLPQWKVDERLEGVELPELNWPFRTVCDPQTRTLVEKTIGLVLADAAVSEADSEPAEG